MTSPAPRPFLEFLGKPAAILERVPEFERGGDGPDR
jgi:hypothetical protein